MTPSAVLQRAVALTSKLRDLQADSARRGVYSEDVHRDFLDAGFYRVLQPRRFRGLQLDVPTYLRLIIAISRGDPGVGWCLALGSGRVLLVASHFGEAAQAEIFGPDGDFRAPFCNVPTGVAKPVDGGFVVSGTWGYASGVPYSTYFIGAALVDPARKERVVFVIPRGEYEILDDWGGDRILGMQASGSNSVRVGEVFVPAHRTVVDWADRALDDGTPGTALHGDPMYLGRTQTFHPAELTATVVGAARAALDEYEALIRNKMTLTSPPVPRFTHHEYRRVFGSALTMTDAAEALLLEAGERYMEFCRLWQETGRPFSVADDVRISGLVLHAGRLASEAVVTLFESAGTSAARSGQRLERYYRDIAMYRTHPHAQSGLVTERIAGALLDSQ